MAGAKGSAVMVTTRIETVALKMDSVFVQRIERLSEDDSWLLFERFAFGMRRRDECASLEPIGKAIVKKCGGVPLVVKALGKLMRLKNEKQWLSVQKSEIWNFCDGESEISPALMLSYINLPPHLKQCFAFCALFPKDFLMEKERLIAMWMANGFIPHKGQEDWYDLGNEIFDELVGRSFFQDVKEDYLGNIISCKMHDVMHDLAQSIMSSECCLIEGNNKKEILGTVRHVAFYDTKLDIKLDEAKSLCSFLSFGFNDLSDIHLPFLARQKHLRTLDLTSFFLSKFPKSIANLKHLRYLDVSRSIIKKLPESITTIQHLETLKLRDCRKLRSALNFTSSLKSLRIGGFGGLTHLPDALLQNCRVLESLEIVSMKSLKSLSNQLDNLSALKSLEISECGELESLPKGLHNLNSLESLTIRDCDALISFSINGLRGLSSLRHLSIQDCHKFASLSDGVRYLTALEHLVLCDCPMLNTLPEDMQHLTSLRSLDISFCNGLSSLPNQIGDLSSLSRLLLLYNSNLMSLPEGLQSLRFLAIDECPSLQKLYKKERGEDWPKIAHIPTIYMDGKLIQSSEA